MLHCTLKIAHSSVVALFSCSLMRSGVNPESARWLANADAPGRYCTSSLEDCVGALPPSSPLPLLLLRCRGCTVRRPAGWPPPVLASGSCTPCRLRVRSGGVRRHAVSYVCHAALAEQRADPTACPAAAEQTLQPASFAAARTEAALLLPALTPSTIRLASSDAPSATKAPENTTAQAQGCM